MADRIRIEGIEFHGNHGVSPEERAVGHRFRVDVQLELDLGPAGRADDLALTVDYEAVARAVVAVGTGPSVQLIEALAERLAGRLMADFAPVHSVEVRVAKLAPASAILWAASAVLIRRER